MAVQLAASILRINVSHEMMCRLIKQRVSLVSSACINFFKNSNRFIEIFLDLSPWINNLDACLEKIMQLDSYFNEK